MAVRVGRGVDVELRVMRLADDRVEARRAGDDAASWRHARTIARRRRRQVPARACRAANRPRPIREDREWSARSTRRAAGRSPAATSTSDGGHPRPLVSRIQTRAVRSAVRLLSCCFATAYAMPRTRWTSADSGWRLDAASRAAMRGRTFFCRSAATPYLASSDCSARSVTSGSAATALLGMSASASSYFALTNQRRSWRVGRGREERRPALRHRRRGRRPETPSDAALVDCDATRDRVRQRLSAGSLDARLPRRLRSQQPDTRVVPLWARLPGARYAAAASAGRPARS